MDVGILFLKFELTWEINKIYYPAGLAAGFTGGFSSSSDSTSTISGLSLMLDSEIFSRVGRYIC